MGIKKPLIIAILCLIGFVIITIIFNVYSITVLPSSFMGAAFGAVITGVVTLIFFIKAIKYVTDLLMMEITGFMTIIKLQEKSNSDEVKEGKVSIFTDKLRIYKEFIGYTWKIWEDRIVDQDNYLELTSKFYRELILYLNNASQRTIGEALVAIGDCINKDANEDNSVEITLRENIVKIIDCLIAELPLSDGIDKQLFWNLDKKIELCRPGRRSMTFKALKIKVGTELVLKKDTSVHCITVDEKNGVEYKNNQYSISGLANEILGGNNNGFICFMMNGKVLAELNKGV
jgi:hypothetical protein